jgi:hypothetical protein
MNGDAVRAEAKSAAAGITSPSGQARTAVAAQKITSQTAGVPRVGRTDDQGPDGDARYQAASPKRRSRTSPGGEYE